MAHLIALADSYGASHQCFRLFMAKRSQSYKNKGTGVRVREIKLYDIIYPEEDEKQVLSDLKAFEFQRRDTSMMDKFKCLIVSIIPGIKNVNMDKVKATEFKREDMRMIGNEDWFVYLKVLGKVKDLYNEDGKELL